MNTFLSVLCYQDVLIVGFFFVGFCRQEQRANYYCKGYGECHFLFPPFFLFFFLGSAGRTNEQMTSKDMENVIFATGAQGMSLGFRV